MASQPLYEVSDPQARPVLVASVDCINGGKMDGPAKHPLVPEERQRLKTSNSIRKQPSPHQVAMEHVRRDQMETQAAAWEDAKSARLLNRYKREESRIQAWEERKITKASVALTKLEMELEKKKAKATEKMQNEVAKARKRAAEMKANAEAKRAEKAAKAAMQAHLLRVVGKSPLSCFFMSHTVDHPDECDNTI